MLDSAQLIGFVPTTDMDRAQAFYSGVLGLTLTEVSPFACVFDSGGTMLRVTRVDDLTPPPFTVTGWAVTDIHTAVTDLTAAGVTFERFDGMTQDGIGVWTTPAATTSPGSRTRTATRSR